MNGSQGTKPIEITVHQGETVKLDAAHSFDPDGDHLSFKWWIQSDAGHCPADLTLEQQGGKANVSLPQWKGDEKIHVICEVTDDGDIPLCSYRRIIISCKSGD